MSSHWSDGRFAATKKLLPVIVGIAVGLAVASGSSIDGQGQWQTMVAALAEPQTAAPTAPPAAVCGSAAILSGPTIQPPGSVRVDPGNDLPGLTRASPVGTTFWLTAGVHTLGTGVYSQIAPADNMTFIGAPGAVLDGQGINAYAFTQKANKVRIAYLTVQNFVAPRDEGVVNHDYGAGWIIEHNTIQHNGGAGVLLGDDNELRYNCLRSNEQYGFQGFGNSMVIDRNEIAGNNTGDLETKYPGCGCTGGAKFWDAQHAFITNNWVHDNKSVGLWADTNDLDFLFEGNYIENNDSIGLMYETSYNAVIRNNTFKRNAIKTGRSNSFPSGAIYLSESGGDGRVPSTVTGTANLEVSGNNFVDNWDGVVLWENADRFCGSPANTSGGYCTIVNAEANLTTCNDPASGGRIHLEPHYSDCRWKTQNVKVHNNIFSFDPLAVGCTTGACGRNGLFSNFGTYPSWSPYKAYLVEDAITSKQGNVWSNNTYTGPWSFTLRDQSSSVSFATWQGAPHYQDVGSTFGAGAPAASTVPPTPTPPTTAVTTGPAPGTPQWYTDRYLQYFDATTTTQPVSTTTTAAPASTTTTTTAATAGAAPGTAEWYWQFYSQYLRA